MVSPRLVVALLVAGTLAAVLTYVRHAVEERAALRQQVATQQETLRLAQRFARVNTRVVTQRLQSAAAIKERADVVQLEIERRLPADPVCVLPPDWRLLHDAAATDTEVPAAARGIDAPSVTPREAARTVAKNYESCHDTADRLHRLQDWVRSVTKENESD